MVHPLIGKNDEKDLLRLGASVWPSLAGRRVFLTGGTGFFGKWLTQALLAADERLNLKLQVTVLARSPEAAIQEQPWLRGRCFHLLKGDVRSFEPPAQSFDFFIHAATSASAHLNENAPDEMADTILEGTRRVLAATRFSERPRFLFVSSGAVYGKQPAPVPLVPETHLQGPDLTQVSSAYGEAKRMAELYCQFAQARGQIQLSVARCYAFMGPYLPLNTHFAAGNFLLDVLSRRPLILKGDGTPYRSYMHPIDLIHWLLTILVQAAPGQVYNVGSGHEIQLGDLARLLDAKRAEFDLPLSEGQAGVQILKSPSAQAVRDAYVPSVEKARRDLNLTIQVSLEDCIRRTLSWYLQNPSAFQTERK